MRIVLAGASGLIGTALVSSLREEGHEITRLLRHPTSEPGTASWDPDHGELDARVLAGADAVVCLSGVGVSDKRWTESYKKLIVSSRVDSVGTIARTMAAMSDEQRPPVFVCASAVGYYGDTGDAVTDESSPSGDSFLADVCRQWEAAAEPARTAGVRVTHVRTGLVLAKGAGLLKPLTLVTELGIGGKLGNGRQYMPWIALTDEIAAIRFVIEHDVPGAANLCAPDPVTNAVFTKTLGRVLRRPTVFVVPGFAAHLVLGEFAWNVLTGQRTIPRALLSAGFTFRYTNLEQALRAELGR